MCGGHAGELALDVPKGEVDRADGAARTERAAEETLPQGQGVARVLPHQERRKHVAHQFGAAAAVPAGSMVLFSAWTWHHSKGNRTNWVRRAFILSYQEATVGTDHAGKWRTLRPAN